MSHAQPKPVADTFLPLDSIRIDGGTQPRAAIDEAIVSEYAEAMNNEAAFPPVVIFYDGVDHWLADGFHRYHAARKLSYANLLAEIRTGTKRDAILHSVGANAEHGKRRTNIDKRRAVETLLADAEWSAWSDREIARRCNVDHVTVGNWRRSLVNITSETAERNYRTKHGTKATMNVANIGKGKDAESQERRRNAIRLALKADQTAPNPVIAKRVGVSSETVRKVREELGLPQATKIFQAQSSGRQVAKFAEAMDGLQGFVLGLQGLPLEVMAQDARVGRWIEQLTELIHALQKVRADLSSRRVQ